jgi:hypothetical protein
VANCSAGKMATGYGFSNSEGNSGNLLLSEAFPTGSGYRLSVRYTGPATATVWLYVLCANADFID